MVPGAGQLEATSSTAQFRLCQNCPDPFNPKTIISFQLPVSSLVTLKVYNTLGQEVAELIHGELMDEGEQEVEFDASKMPSGVYYYRLVAASVDEKTMSYTGVKRMMLVK